MVQKDIEDPSHTWRNSTVKKIPNSIVLWSVYSKLQVKFILRRWFRLFEVAGYVYAGKDNIKPVLI